MARSTRPLAFVALAAAALFVAGCGKSENEGKIVGKWKLVSAPGLEQAAQQMEMVKGYLYMEFKQDGTMTMGADFQDQAMRELVEKMAAQSGEKISWTWKYKLLSGDGVEFYDLPKELQDKGGMFGKNKDRARTHVKIDGDNMTMKDDDGKTGTCVRVK